MMRLYLLVQIVSGARISVDEANSISVDMAIESAELDDEVMQLNSSTAADQEFCAARCQAQGYCCNDGIKGSNQMISCSQACLIRARGRSTASMLSANGGLCNRRGNSGCSLNVMGHRYGFCVSCDDLQPHCPHGVQSSAECDFGARLVPPSLNFWDQADSALTATPGALTGTGRVSWNTPANGALQVNDGDGICGISFKCNTPQSHLLIGLASRTVRHWGMIDFGICCRGGWRPQLDVYESSRPVHQIAPRANNGNPTTDVHAIQINAGGQVEYSLNGNVYYTSSASVSYPWHIGLDTYQDPSLSEVEYLSCSGDPWTIILQYGSTAYQPNTGAVGTLDEDQKQHAKLSDAAINALPSGGDAGYDHYKLTSESTATANARDTLFLRVPAGTVYQDSSTHLGFEGAEACMEETLDKCDSWMITLGRNNGIDTIFGTSTNTCTRWLTGIYNTMLCYSDPNSGGRCWSSGASCPFAGTHAMRQDVKMYRLTA